MNTDEKHNSLVQTLASFPNVLVAFSGGVDSTLLLKVAVDTLGADKVLACIGVSGSLSQHQHEQASELARSMGVRMVELPVDELDDSAYTQNKADRCFHCKSHLFGRLIEVAREHGVKQVVCGNNFDDKDDFRPGNRAAIQLGVRAPLMEAELTKQDIREISRKLGLPTAEMPASPCLASRISYGLEITEDRLKQVEQAEELLRSLGLVEFRVRHHGELARIEVRPDDIPQVTSEGNRRRIVERLKDVGFKYISLDLQGFRSGAMNEALSEQEKKRHI